jgi:hypothetical protein
LAFDVDERRHQSVAIVGGTIERAQILSGTRFALTRGRLLEPAQNDQLRLEAGAILLDQGYERTLGHLPRCG